MELKPQHFIEVPVSEFTKPRTGMFNVFVDYWWEVTKDDCLLFFRGGYKRSDLYTSPQCNKDERIARSLSEKFRGLPFEIEVKQIPIVYVPIKLRDYV